jgi:hypothetical protein
MTQTNTTKPVLVVHSGNWGHRLYVNGKLTVTFQDGAVLDRYIDRSYPIYASLTWA